MEEKIIVRYQRSADFEDSFPEAGDMNASEALLFFDNFPFEADCAEWPELPINSPYPTVHFKRPDNAYARVQMQHAGEYVMELQKGGDYFETLFNVDFNENPKQETREFLAEFFSGSLDERIEWITLPPDEGPDPEIMKILANRQLEFHYKPSLKHWVYFPETMFAVLSLFLIYMGIFVNSMMLIIAACVLASIPAYRYSILLRLKGQVKGSRLAIFPDKQSFLFEKDDISRLIHRDEIKESTLIHYYTRGTYIIATELRLVLKDGSKIKMNTLLFDPQILVQELKLKYTVL
ncbi:MAG: hypothetical protein ACYC1Q_11240 [Bacteroidia bacterium]